MRAKNSRRLNAEELRVFDWKYPDEGALSQGATKDGYFARKKAITLYFEGATESEIKEQAGIGLSQTIRLIGERCLLVHRDGEVWGWRALVPWERINSYQRRRKINVDKFGQGAVGAFQLSDTHNFCDSVLTTRDTSFLQVFMDTWAAVNPTALNIRLFYTNQNLRVLLRSLRQRIFLPSIEPTAIYFEDPTHAC